MIYLNHLIDMAINNKWSNKKVILFIISYHTENVRSPECHE